MKILIVEDEPGLRASMAAFFGSQHQVLEAGDLAAATTALTQSPELMILDLTLPDGDGLPWLQLWRPSLSAKVVVLTANDQESTELQGLKLADEYLVKPVSLRVLAARVAKLWPAADLQIGALSVDFAAHRVTRSGQPITLTAAEWRLFSYLVQNRGQILSREQIIASLWDTRDAFVADNTLTVTMKRLRDKLEPDPAKPQLLRTIRGMGYFLDAQA
ncbi:MAG: response regulator transcription factor [Lactobacillus sp.]|jgi:DNA-binding response OmpR family regulator|uniref:Response regulator transcription factor n=1 Tax=Lacticaseibacillus suilingensis TaxID=2799577 RepID=A0ABW4BI98_9LACO|nr:response regulator transcription factor [Lacticaseibacillus suilingensis]MCI1893687.1 response regulator transcription factor [Lactobacillus sp.]MCI1916764.1 response regulator transcription factor [Lactobacillus sp.]MCI1941322.1 response regulator transcription factor [Lactobacillus sp.]MCI1971866.1 response regulator transcription factor [Lactobacillus sp.]MCI2017088.1 response regulator transcription factor [Lactobacillus sp.]